MKILNSNNDIECENRLVKLLNYDKFDLIKLLLKNRTKIYFCTKLGQAQSAPEKEKIMELMRETQIGEQIIEGLEKIKFKKDREKENIRNVKKEAKNLSKISKKAEKFIGEEDEREILETNQITDEDFAKIHKKIIDFDSLVFTQGNHFMSNEKCQLPQGSYRLSKKGYDEVYIPAIRHKDVKKNKRTLI